MVVEVGEWYQGAHINERSRIKKQIDDVGEHGIVGLSIEVTTKLVS